MTKVALEAGEMLVSLLIDNFDESPEEEQIIAYRNLTEKNGSIYITYIAFDRETQEYRRVWSAPTAASRPGTVRLYTQDLLGDRNTCVILRGMNNKDEHTLTVFRKTPASLEAKDPPFTKIAELQINGTITIQEVPRTLAYQQGYAKGEDFPLVVRSPMETAANTSDQQEITYTYNEVSGSYEQSTVAYIPGKQIEQRRLQDLLSNVKVFEGFIDGLWYYVSPQGTLDSRQYIYFDPQRKELIFYGDESQQVFLWQGSNITRYGLYITSQNISVTTLRRSLDIELESMDSIRVRVSEDVRLRIGVTASWDGSYRKARAFETLPEQTAPVIPSYIAAEYSGSMGKIQFFQDGGYTLSSEGTTRRGKYAFFLLNDQELLEFRPENGSSGSSRSAGSTARELYLVEHAKNEASSPQETGYLENLTLLPIRIGTQGIQKLHQTAMFLVKYDPLEEQAEEPSPALSEEVPPVAEEGLPVPILSFSSQPEYFSPDNDGENDELTMFLGAQGVSPIAAWSLDIREPQPPYLVFYHIEGKGNPPERIVWNGRSNKGELVQAATDYPFTFKAEDTQGSVGSLNGVIGVDILVIREGNGLRIQVPSIIFRAGYADFVGLPQETVDNNNRVLRRIAEILNKFRNYQVRIEGHANRTQSGDKLEEEETTELQPLSESRARTVVNYLVQFGVNRNRLTPVGMGSTRPVADFEDRNNWWKNRRVEFILLK
jgi:flagellar motor protein MotB